MFEGTYQATSSAALDHVAIKRFTPAELSAEFIREYAAEVALLVALKHPNIVRFTGMFIAPPEICLLFELCESSLEGQLASIAASSWVEKLHMMLQVADSVHFLHTRSPPVVLYSLYVPVSHLPRVVFVFVCLQIPAFFNCML